jgi:hypothetical protein
VEDLPGVDQYRMERLLRSAIRALSRSIDSEAVRALFDIYGGARDLDR